MDADGDVPEGVPVEERSEVSMPSGGPAVVVQTKDKAPRDFYITMKDAEKHG